MSSQINLKPLAAVTLAETHRYLTEAAEVAQLLATAPLADGESLDARSVKIDALFQKVQSTLNKTVTVSAQVKKPLKEVVSREKPVLLKGTQIVYDFNALESTFNESVDSAQDTIQVRIQEAAAAALAQSSPALAALRVLSPAPSQQQEEADDASQTFEEADTAPSASLADVAATPSDALTTFATAPFANPFGNSTFVAPAQTGPFVFTTPDAQDDQDDQLPFTVVQVRQQTDATAPTFDTAAFQAHLAEYDAQHSGTILPPSGSASPIHQAEAQAAATPADSQTAVRVLTPTQITVRPAKEDAVDEANTDTTNDGLVSEAPSDSDESNASAPAATQTNGAAAKSPSSNGSVSGSGSEDDEDQVSGTGSQQGDKQVSQTAGQDDDAVSATGSQDEEEESGSEAGQDLGVNSPTGAASSVNELPDDVDVELDGEDQTNCEMPGRKSACLTAAAALVGAGVYFRSAIAERAQPIIQSVTKNAPILWASTTARVAALWAEAPSAAQVGAYIANTAAVQALTDETPSETFNGVSKGTVAKAVAGTVALTTVAVGYVASRWASKPKAEKRD